MSDDTTDDIPEPARIEPVKLKYLTRVTLRKFEGDDTSGSPVETVVRKDDGFDERVAQLKAQFEKEDPNAAD